ncbi:MAG: OsmC family protein [Candidatus Magnetominusculus sp. LBB02]|nr:OsmC family protein [Candidatus Magnetominusculus sp. LBB02]
MDILITFPGGKRVNAEFSAVGDALPVVIATDQPVKYGGGGTAPEPFKLFLASIGTCAGIFVLSFCQKNAIPTEGITIEQNHQYITDATGKSKFAKITLDIKVPPDFPEKYYDAIVRVADQCAVKKAIMEQPEIEVKTVVARG